ncbi:hypothetical protein EMIT0P12_50495 [Pseudomonas sp. IT-P12]
MPDVRQSAGLRASRPCREQARSHKEIQGGSETGLPAMAPALSMTVQGVIPQSREQ